VARTRAGDVAEHRLTFVPTAALHGAVVLAALRHYGEFAFGDATAGFDRCRRLGTRLWRCRETAFDDVGISAGVNGVADVALRDDGLIAITSRPTDGEPFGSLIVEPA
jgi:hypothetical protein